MGLWQCVLDWYGACEGWIAKREKLGGSEFVAFCTGINIAQMSWTGFQDAVRRGDELFNKTFQTILSNSSYANRKHLLETFITWMFRPAEKVIWFFRHANRWLAIILAIAGLAMLYFGATCPWDFLLLIPPVVYVVLSYLALGLLWCIGKLAGALVNKIDAVRETEAFIEESKGTATNELANSSFAFDDSGQKNDASNETPPSKEAANKAARKNGQQAKRAGPGKKPPR